MNNNILFPEKIKHKLKNTSNFLGISEEDFLINAVLYYLKVVEKQASFKQEIDMWNEASDEDFLNFEKKL